MKRSHDGSANQRMTLGQNQLVDFGLPNFFAVEHLRRTRVPFRGQSPFYTYHIVTKGRLALSKQDYKHPRYTRAMGFTSSAPHNKKMTRHHVLSHLHIKEINNTKYRRAMSVHRVDHNGASIGGGGVNTAHLTMPALYTAGGGEAGRGEGVSCADKTTNEH